MRLSKCSAFLMVDSQIIVILISCHCYHRAFDMIIILSFADFNSTAAPLNSMTSWLERGACGLLSGSGNGPAYSLPLEGLAYAPG